MAATARPERKICFSCGKTIDLTGTPGRGDSCRFCTADLRACLNCRFRDDSSYNECREPQAERVKEKDRSNYCEYFEFAESSADGGLTGESRKENPLDRLKDLFKDT
ncbi:hypothetical protein MNBD_DELTA02-25 [hydrothermal vent metagenome]|uniref:Uncharacterized protein n=1 Tax=hydrothermal vent metagenome TaxID=652676 RepID=A0A3B0VHB5_9ZZZZ